MEKSGTGSGKSNLIWLIGYMGSGKSTVGLLLAERLGYDFTDSDRQIEELHKVTIAELFSGRGEPVFRNLEKQFVESISSGPCVVACGGGLPCFNNLMESLLHKGTVVYLEASPETLSDRLQHEMAIRPLLNGLSANELPAFIRERLAERSPVYNRATIILHTDNKFPETIVEELIGML